MPTILLIGPYRFFFYATDRNEPPHVHVERDDSVLKFWLDPVRLNYSQGFKPKELRRIEKIVSEKEKIFLEAWNEYFGY